MSGIIGGDNDLMSVGDSYGADEEEPIPPAEDDTEQVVVLPVQCDIDEERQRQMREDINPLIEDSAFGCNLYLQALDIATATL